MAQHSAGVLIYRQRETSVEVLLVHPGGPYWRNKDFGAWQIPKGGIEPGEEPAAAAVRETEEELGITLAGALQPLAQIRQSGGKLVDAFALEQEVDTAAIVSNTFAIEWPPRSGIIQFFPEIDAARWMTLSEAGEAILPSQESLLWALEAMLAR